MPPAVSPHTCTAINPSQISSIHASTKAIRSKTNSISTTHSDSFIHAHGLDSEAQVIPSYYLDDKPQHRSFVGSLKRNESLPSPATSEHSCKISLLPQGLIGLINMSDVESSTKRMLLAMVRMIVFVSRELFHTSSVLVEGNRSTIKQIAEDICEFLDLVLEKLEERIVTAGTAHAIIVEHEEEDELPLEDVAKWVEMVDALHEPTHVEAKIFSRMATLYEELVYMPFLQLHRDEPENTAYILDPFLGAIFIRLRFVIKDTHAANKLVRDIERKLDAKMTPATKRHTPSKSAPVAVLPRVLQLRHRENTL